MKIYIQSNSKEKLYSIDVICLLESPVVVQPDLQLKIVPYCLLLFSPWCKIVDLLLLHIFSPLFNLEFWLLLDSGTWYLQEKGHLIKVFSTMTSHSAAMKCHAIVPFLHQMFVTNGMGVLVTVNDMVVCLWLISTGFPLFNQRYIVIACGKSGCLHP